MNDHQWWSDEDVTTDQDVYRDTYTPKRLRELDERLGRKPLDQLEVWDVTTEEDIARDTYTPERMRELERRFRKNQ